ncbi:ABC transporter ATP-binding protein [Nonomuraea soli]|uniref:ABC-2 type transport system ATP-binding protein n=1 Tax=Nonomuraea soli TaxID=1032476 RepID=A0A7W0CKV8_9ACTN|nr:ABC transporter ATP-binding protein [Nonomuraea soli]MBA2893010.1 ABC-2 type transport system ATP-binding protein [Nonomuraea soli]
MTPVEVEGLRATYGDFVAVDGIDLRVHQGEMFALLGTNGAGKTTTLETLEGHRRAQEGQVRVMGLDPFAHRRRLAGTVATMLQDSGFAGELTAAETLRMWQRLHPGRQGPADPLAEVDLDHRRDVRVQQLSGGERRRLDLALAISTDPDLLFLDEPTTGLDPESRERTWRVLRDLLERGRSILLTTHYLEEAEALADRIAIMHRGRIAVSGTLAEVVGAHASRIRCELPAVPDKLPLFEGEAALDGRRLTIRTRCLQADLHRLLTWADAEGQTLKQLSATEASLAEIFKDVNS